MKRQPKGTWSAEDLKRCALAGGAKILSCLYSDFILGTSTEHLVASCFYLPRGKTIVIGLNCRNLWDEEIVIGGIDQSSRCTGQYR